MLVSQRVLLSKIHDLPLTYSFSVTSNCVGKARAERSKQISLLENTKYSKILELERAWMLFCLASHLADVKPESRKKDVAGIW